MKFLRCILFLSTLSIKQFMTRTKGYEIEYNLINNVNFNSIVNSKDLFDTFYNENENKSFQLDNTNFKFAINCLYNNETLCGEVDTTIKKVINTLSNTLEIYQPIVFDVYVDDLSKYGYDRLIAGCTDTNHVALRTSDDIHAPPYTYPQALVKQLNLNKNIEFKEKDFTLLVNINTTYADALNITYQVNLEQSILHEILHGLGFGSETGHIKELDMTYTNKTLHSIYDYVYTPREMYEINKEMLVSVEGHSDYFYLWSSTEYKGLYPLSVYEKNFVDLHTQEPIFKGLEFLYQALDCANKTYLINASDELPNCVGRLDSDTRERISYLPMNYYFKYHTIGFLNAVGKVIPLQTFDKVYREGGSISHIEFTNEKSFNQYLNDQRSALPADQTLDLHDIINEDNIYDLVDENLLMYYCETGIDKELALSTVAQTNPYGWISPDILSVLITLGWTEKGLGKPSDLYYVVDEIEIPEQRTFPLNRKYYEYGANNEMNVRSSESPRNLERSFPYLSLLLFTLIILFL